jgi:hypothetical protein
MKVDRNAQRIFEMSDYAGAPCIDVTPMKNGRALHGQSRRHQMLDARENVTCRIAICQ